MPDNVIRICDHERKSREPDAVAPRDPCDATIIILPSSKESATGGIRSKQQEK